ncbi:unnamed protein product [Prorocentrum cordatum]|uniref:Calmodulin n=1 Tax=Prorocentrum cordatum TaxID=2364126 RepID=A0ABN9VLV8_9DINO|nr:unnamed protein product [Polarella glacialis]
MAQRSDMWAYLPALLAAARDFTTLGLHWQTAAADAQCPSLPAIPACPELVCATGPTCPAAQCECACPVQEPGYWLLLAGAGVATAAGLAGLCLGAGVSYALGRIACPRAASRSAVGAAAPAVGDAVSTEARALPRALDIREPQTVVHFDADPLPWHHRVLLHHLGDGAWLCLTPDTEITRHDLNSLRPYVLDRGALFPAWALAGLYSFDPVGPGELAEMKRQARQRAALLGAGDALEEEAQVWVISDPRDARFGEVLDEQAVENPARRVHLRRMGVISLDGTERTIVKIGREERGDWMGDQREGVVDIRLFGDHRSKLGRRDVDFRDAVEMMEQVELADSPDIGPRAMGEYLTRVAVGTGNLTAYQAEWPRLSGVFAGEAQNHEHRVLLEIIRRAICLDQLNVKNLHCMEAAVRRAMQIEMVVARHPRHPDFSGLEDIISGPTQSSGSASVPKYLEHVVARQKDRANILKQMRWHKEELERVRPGSDDKDKRLECEASPSATGDWWPRGQWLHNDPFPLPVAEVEARPVGAPRSTARRWRVRSERQRRVSEAVEMLNYLAAPRVNSGCDKARSVRPHGGAPTAVQRSVLESVQEWVGFFGGPPCEAVDGERSLREILLPTDQYELEPQHLASYDVTRLRVCKGDIRPVPVAELLPAEAAVFLRHFRSQIELTASEAADRIQQAGGLPEPSWDPVLRGDAELRRDFFRRLAKIGIVGFRRVIEFRCGAFVHKKDGDIRFICDARATNMCHRPPPRTALGGAASLSEIDLSSYATSLGGSGGVCEPRFSWADVKDCFYQLANEEMGSWFGFDSPLTVEEWDLDLQRVWDDEEVVSHHVRQSCVDGDRQLLRDKRPAPLLRPGKPLAAVCVGNFTGVGGSAADAREGVEAFHGQAAEAGLGLHAAEVAVEELESLGLVLFSADRRVRQKPRRVWRFYFATKALLRRGRASGAELRTWAGRAVSLLGLQPCLLSILQEVYHFIGDGSRRRMAFPKLVRGELRMAAIAVFLTEVGLGAPLSDEVRVSDSSTGGFCLMYGKKPLRAVWGACRWRERWRFVEVEAEVSTGVYTAAYLNQLRGVTDGFGSTLDEGAPKFPDPHALTDGSGWTAAVEGRWRYDEHINVKEGRICVAGLRRFCRAAAYSVGCRVRWRVRHVPTYLNVADAGSRRHEAPDPEWLKQRKKERQPGVSRVVEFGTFVELEFWSVSGSSLLSSLQKLFENVNAVELVGVLKNPMTSGLWSFPPIGRLAGLKGAQWMRFPMCAYGAPHQKWTLVLANIPELRGLSAPCTHRRHVPLVGKARAPDGSGGHVWRNLTALAGQYPSALCSSWASVLSEIALLAARGPDVPWGGEWLAAARALVRLPQRAAGKPHVPPPTKQRAATRCVGPPMPTSASTAPPSARRAPPSGRGSDGVGRPSTFQSPRRWVSAKAKASSRRRRAASAGGSRVEYMRQMSVAAFTLTFYRSAVDSFEEWCREEGRQSNSTQSADENMVRWFSGMFFDGMGPGTGRNGLFGWVLLRGDRFQDGRQLLPRARRQLKAWGRADPGAMGLPCPLVLVYAIALDLLNRGLVRMAACVVLQTDLYSRPSETLTLSEADILHSQPAAGRAFAGRWAVVFAPGESGRRTETGQVDDAVDVGICGREWVRDVASALKDSVHPGQRVFDFDLPTYERQFKVSLKRQRLQAVGGSPHWLRRSGPSNDRFEAKLDLQAIQERGRWISFKSVTRYEKHAELLKQLERCDPGQIRNAKHADTVLPERLLHSLREFSVLRPVPRISGGLAKR